MHTTFKNDLSRREFVHRMMAASAVLIPAVAVLSGCGDKKTQDKTEESVATDVTDCRDLTGVSKADLAIREKLAYVNESPLPESECANCNLYLPPANGKKCGGCMLFKGPVEAKGYCTYWAPKI